MWDQERVVKAWNFAAKLHKDQKVPGVKYPYLNHLGNVTFEIMAAVSADSSINAELAILCAILHDTIEDTEGTYEDILREFGVDVADGVMALTKDVALPDKQAMMTDSLKRIRKQPKEVWMVKMSDRITNLQPPPEHWDNDKILRYQSEAQQIYDALKDANDLLAERLKSKIDNYTSYLEK
jgi:(p)ppGpp synthase/HD superfamily hydrolase